MARPNTWDIHSYPGDVAQHTLDVLRYKIQETADLQALRGARLEPEVIIDQMGDRILYRLRADILGKRMDERTVESERVQYPCNWIEAVKERWFPKWAKKKWPVRYTVKQLSVRVRFDVLYPEIEVPQANSQTFYFMERLS